MCERGECLLEVAMISYRILESNLTHVGYQEYLCFVQR
jgi:hypothetical protein